MEEETKRLKILAYKMRKEIIQMTNKAKSGHPGGSLSCIDILTCLYFNVLRHNPENPEWEERDFFILSKGHASPAFYSVLSYSGYFEKDELKSFRQLNSRLQGHPEKGTLKGVEITTGSLGQGLSIANGIALGLKLKKSTARVYCLLGDGELQEGQLWEAIQSAGHRKLDNLCVILDRNRLQIDGFVEDLKKEEPLEDKLKSFLFNVLRIDGHNFNSILDAFNIASKTRSKPTFIIADTIKGKGVSFMENNVKFHGVPPDDEETETALREIDEELRKMERE